MRRLLTLLLPLAGLALACDDSSTGPAPETPTSIAVDRDVVTMNALGDTVAVAAAVLDEEGDTVDAVVLWTSLDSLIAQVDDAGRVVAEGNGITRVVASYGDFADSVVVYVEQLVTAIEIQAPAAFELTMGDTMTFPVVATDANGHVVADTRFGWETVEQGYAAVSVVSGTLSRGQRGGVIAVAPGVATVRATELASGVTDEVQVTVHDHTIDFAQVSAGGITGCGLDQAGGAWCWGSRYIGEYPVIGGFGSTNFHVPVRVDGNLAFDTIVTGHSAGCGLVDGTAWCWGLNTEGSLGSGTIESSEHPVQVAGGLTFTTISGGLFHTCGLVPSGEAWCWGGNVHGQLGDSTLTERLQPVAVVGGLQFESIAAGPYHTCGLTTAGEAWCWGLNETQQLGTTEGDTECMSILGPYTCSLAPVRVPADSLGFVSIHPGGYHTCGLTASGAAWCWGQNDLGELGMGEATQGGTLAAQAVAGGHTFASLSTAMTFTCGLEADGDAFCWGRNDWGQLGNTDAVTCFTSWLTADPCMPMPIPVSGSVPFASIDAGTYFACGYSTAGIPYCWGENSNRQLGAGTDAPDWSALPLQVWGSE